MTTIKTILFLATFLIPVASNSATLNLYNIERATGAEAYFASMNNSHNSSELFGLYQMTNQANEADPGLVAQAYADQNSNVSLLTNILSVSATGNCNASFTITGNGFLGNVVAQFAIQINFNIDSTFNFSIQTRLTQTNITNHPIQNDYQNFVGLIMNTNTIFIFGQSDSYGIGPSSSNICGILQPGNYLISVGADLQNTGSSTYPGSYSAGGHYNVVLSIFPDPPPIYITAIGDDQAQITWSTNYTGFTLETSSNWPTAYWQTATNKIAVIGQEYSTTVDTLQTASFFRLRNN